LEYHAPFKLFFCIGTAVHVYNLQTLLFCPAVSISPYLQMVHAYKNLILCGLKDTKTFIITKSRLLGRGPIYSIYVLKFVHDTNYVQ
ncbi:hypothetical protein SOVF_082870, partial [Spinacia oleracea]